MICPNCGNEEMFPGDRMLASHFGFCSVCNPYKRREVMRLKDFQRNLAKEIFGVDMDRSINDRVCVSCGKPCSPDNIRDQAEVMEFFKSGLCGVCFDRIFEVLTEEEVALYRLAQSEEKE